MNEQELATFFRDSSPEEIRRDLEDNLDVPSPVVGSRGPTAPGPEERYLRALESCDADVRAKAGDAVNRILLTEAEKAAARPLLLFNLLGLLRAVGLPGVDAGLAALRYMRDTLSTSLVDRGDDLYRRTLLAIAENQRGDEWKEFWKRLLEEPGCPYGDVAVIGLRNAGWYAGCETLRDVKEAYQKHPHLGDFSLAVMLLVDEHPEANWPGCARIFYDEFHGPDILHLIEEHSRGRYEVPLSEMEAEPGTALSDLQRRIGAEGLARIDRRFKAQVVSPDRALKSA